MSIVISQATGPAGRVGELALWGIAGIVMLSVHFGAAVYLMRADAATPGDNAPPAAIMIELAAEPVAANTEAEQISPELADQQAVQSEQTQPVEQAQPEPMQSQPEPTPEPAVEPMPEPVQQPPPEMAEPVEPAPPEPMPAEPTPPEPTLPEPAPPEPVMQEPAPEPPQPTPDITQTIPQPAPPEPLPEPMPEPPPEPVEKIEPIPEKPTAALEEVEVPLPMIRPLPPPPVVQKPPEETKKPEPKKQTVVRKIQKPKQQLLKQRPSQKEMAAAKLQTTQADRTAANQNLTGSVAPSVTPAAWKSRVQARLARSAQQCPGNGSGTAAVRFHFDGSGNVTGVALSRSSGDPKIDDYIVSAVRRASPIPAPPSGAPSYLEQALTCLR